MLLLLVLVSALFDIEGPCRTAIVQQTEVIAGRVAAGDSFAQPFANRFTFHLLPLERGWEIVIREAGREENLARLTPPWHFVPNPRDIEGWHFRSVDNTVRMTGVSMRRSAFGNSSSRQKWAAQSSTRVAQRRTRLLRGWPGMGTGGS
jgi:hypothetical protein